MNKSLPRHQSACPSRPFKHPILSVRQKRERAQSLRKRTAESNTMDHQRKASQRSSSQSRRRSSRDNPFAGGDRLNFPSFERALAPPYRHRAQQAREDEEDVDNASSSPSESLDLSMDARAALCEHLRHVAKYGVDGEVTAATAYRRPPEPHNTSVDLSEAGTSIDTTPLLNTLDEEWENILQGNHTMPDFPDVSFQSSVLPTFSRLQVLNTASNGEDIEVAVMEMTHIEPSEEEDYFNSSKVWQLMTPEKNRTGRQQAVTERNLSYDQSSYNDAEEDDAPSSACMADMYHEEERPFRPRFSVSPKGSPDSYKSSPISLQNLPPDLPAVAAAAANAAVEWERSPQQKRVASVAITDFSERDNSGLCNSLISTRDGSVVEEPAAGLHNSLLATSIHEDLPLITSPFDAVVPDPEGSFADWSVQSPEHSFTLPSAVTPIRPLPPLSPIHNLRGSPASSHRGSSSNSNSNSNSRSGARSSSSSASFGRSWRAQAISPQRLEDEFALPLEMASPIPASVSPHSPSDSLHSNSAKLSGNAMAGYSDPTEKAKPSPSLSVSLEAVDDGVEAVEIGSMSSDPLAPSPQSVRTARDSPSLSPLAAQAAHAAARYLRTSSNPHQRPLSKSQWPAGEIALAPTDSFESSTVGMADSKVSVRRVRTGSAHEKDASTAPLVSLDTMDSDRSESSKHSHGACTTLSVDGVKERRRVRSVVPRRILFPSDFAEGIDHGDSFDRPSHVPSNSF